MKALDLFCGQGGVTRGLQDAGFHVTGVDLNPQPRYCGDAFIQADAMTFPLDGFDFIWASPPCQAWTRLRVLHPERSYPELIVPMRKRLVASRIPWTMENVEDAPMGESGFLIVLCGTMFGLGTPDGSAELRRHRLFETSFSIPLRPRCQHGSATLTVTGTDLDNNKNRNLRRLEVITVCGHTPVTPRGTINVAGKMPWAHAAKRREVISVVGGAACR